MLGARALSGEPLAGWSQATSEAAHVGEAVTARGRGSPEPPSLAQPRPGQPALAIWPVCSSLLGCVASALATARLRPGLSCSRGSDPQSHQCPRAADLLEAVGSADSNEVFLREEGEGSRSAVGQGESCMTGVYSCVSPQVPLIPGGPLAREAAVPKMATGGAVTPQPPGCPVSLNRLVSKPESHSLHGGLCVHAKSLSRVRLCVTPRAVARQATWNSPSKNTGVGFRALLQEIFPTQGLNPHLLCLLRWQAGPFPLALPTWEAAHWFLFHSKKKPLTVAESLHALPLHPLGHLSCPLLIPLRGTGLLPVPHIPQPCLCLRPFAPAVRTAWGHTPLRNSLTQPSSPSGFCSQAPSHCALPGHPRLSQPLPSTPDHSYFLLVSVSVSYSVVSNSL